MSWKDDLRTWATTPRPDLSARVRECSELAATLWKHHGLFQKAVILAVLADANEPLTQEELGSFIFPWLVRRWLAFYDGVEDQSVEANRNVFRERLRADMDTLCANVPGNRTESKLA